jgi:hypothetical protein
MTEYRRKYKHSIFTISPIKEPGLAMPSGHADYLPRLLLIDASARVALGSFSEAHRDFLSVRCVPISAPYDEILSVSFGENSPLSSMSEAIYAS